MTTGIRTTQNKFSFLTVQDSSESDGNVDEVKILGKSKAKLTNNAKKRARKKKKKEQESMQSLDDVSQPLSNDHQIRDQQLVEQIFEEDLWKAVELSKLEFEKEQQTFNGVAAPKKNPEQKSLENEEEQVTLGKSAKKAEKQKRKEDKQKSRAAKTISLQEFQQHIEDTLPIKIEADQETPQRTSHKSEQHKGDGDFFNSVDAEVKKIKVREHHKNPSNAAAIESCFVNERVRNEIEQKDSRIEILEKENETLKTQCKTVKKRNQQLLVILQQGEMKGKAEMLIEIEKLNNIRDDLTTEVAELHEMLEKERSKVSKLNNEVKVLKQSRSHNDD
uniref:G kinase-anchoring protein 1 n=1 Tax=Ciona savignyi TaxID=51511 RepID=H2ZC60_CIOSA